MGFNSSAQEIAIVNQVATVLNVVTGPIAQKNYWFWPAVSGEQFAPTKGSGVTYNNFQGMAVYQIASATNSTITFATIPRYNATNNGTSKVGQQVNITVPVFMGCTGGNVSPFVFNAIIGVTVGVAGQGFYLGLATHLSVGGPPEVYISSLSVDSTPFIPMPSANSIPTNMQVVAQVATGELFIQLNPDGSATFSTGGTPTISYPAGTFPLTSALAIVLACVSQTAASGPQSFGPVTVTYT